MNTPAVNWQLEHPDYSVFDKDVDEHVSFTRKAQANPTTRKEEIHFMYEMCAGFAIPFVDSRHYALDNETFLIMNKIAPKIWVTYVIPATRKAYQKKNFIAYVRAEKGVKLCGRTFDKTIVITFVKSVAYDEVTETFIAE